MVTTMAYKPIMVELKHNLPQPQQPLQQYHTIVPNLAIPTPSQPREPHFPAQPTPKPNNKLIQCAYIN